jgi:hypothetical protein
MNIRPENMTFGHDRLPTRNAAAEMLRFASQSPILFGGVDSLC